MLFPRRRKIMLRQARKSVGGGRQTESLRRPTGTRRDSEIPRPDARSLDCRRPERQLSPRCPPSRSAMTLHVDSGLRPECANSGHRAAAPRTGEVDLCRPSRSACEWAASAGKRTLAEGVRCAMSGRFPREEYQRPKVPPDVYGAPPAPAGSRRGQVTGSFFHVIAEA